MKSFIMGVFFLGVAIGNYVAMGVNMILDSIKKESGSNPLEGADYYWFFAAAMALTTIAYVIWAQFYKGETYIQGEDLVATEMEAEAEGTDPR
jgi:POT family proton-dependent oligopeptide transporter